MGLDISVYIFGVVTFCSKCLLLPVIFEQYQVLWILCMASTVAFCCMCVLIVSCGLQWFSTTTRLIQCHFFCLQRIFASESIVLAIICSGSLSLTSQFSSFLCFTVRNSQCAAYRRNLEIHSSTVSGLLLLLGSGLMFQSTKRTSLKFWFNFLYSLNFYYTMSDRFFSSTETIKL